MELKHVVLATLTKLCISLFFTTMPRSSIVNVTELILCLCDREKEDQVDQLDQRVTKATG